ncbi:MAG: aminotransferase class III-fold pyridoxal phosphate-dependent enzyme, partial [Candidatus Thorarchaeota archaeon]
MDENLIPKDLRKAYSTKEILELEKKHVVPAVTHYYEQPLLLIQGKGATLEDASGKQYIDLFAGICTTITGYAHPKFVATLQWQIKRLVYTSSLYATIPYAILSQRLAEIAPDGLTQ